MEERRAGIVGVVVVALVVLGVGLQGAAWGQPVEADQVQVAQAGRVVPRRIGRAPAEPEWPAPERIDELNRHREELGERARQRQAELRELEEARIARQREVRAELGEIHEQLARVEANLLEIQRQQEEARRRMLARAQDESARLNERLRDLQAQAEQMERTLAQIRERDGERARALEISLAETREQMHRLEIELHWLDEARPMPLPRPLPPGREVVPPRIRERELRYERPLPRGRRPAPESREIIIEPRRPALEMREQLDDIHAQVIENSERLNELQARLYEFGPDPDLAVRVEQLSVEVNRLNEKSAYPQVHHEACVGVLPPQCPGTVGSAGYRYRWYPNYGLYYLY